MVKALTRIFSAALGAMVISAALTTQGFAGQLSSPWVIDQYTKSRLFIGDYDKARKILHLGWQLSLKEGWKTYWRSPGDAGLPPRWNWQAQNNVHRINVFWPAPEKLRIFDMDTYVYHDEVVLPVEVAIVDDTKPVSLSLDLEFMVCAEICVPLEGRYGLNIPSLENIKTSLFQKALLNRYADQVPQKIPAENVVITADPQQQKTLRVELPAPYHAVDRMIVEGPEGVLFREPRVVPAPGKKIFRVGYEAEKTLVGEALTLTLIPSSGRGHEMTVTVAP